MSSKRAPSASRLREQLAARNGPRHSVYWVQPKGPATGRKATSTGSVSYTEVGNMGAAAKAVEYKVVGKYTGDWKNGKKHGFGALVYANGSKYEGEWREGKRHGRGVYWVAGDESSGGDKLRKQYAGEWVNDKRHGVGTLFYPNGARYEGFWVDNNRVGTGRMEYAPGSTDGDHQGVYEGEWLNNGRSGRGILVLENGDRYDGYWLNDKKEGPGRYYYKATRKVYEGEWVDGTPKCGTYHDKPDDDNSDEESEETGDKSIPSNCKFQLPELGLARPDQVVSEMIASIRQERLRDMALRHAVPVEVSLEELQIEPNEGEHSPVMGSAPIEGVIFDDETLRLIRREFSAILQDEQQSESASKGELVTCAALPRLLDAIQLRIPDDQIEDFLSEIGASAGTRVSFDECVDMLSLLAEGESAPGDDNEAFEDGDDASVDDNY